MVPEIVFAGGSCGEASTLAGARAWRQPLEYPSISAQTHSEVGGVPPVPTLVRRCALCWKALACVLEALPLPGIPAALLAPLRRWRLVRRPRDGGGSSRVACSVGHWVSNQASIVCREARGFQTPNGSHAGLRPPEGRRARPFPPCRGSGAA